MKWNWRYIVYFAIGAVFFVVFGYLGTTRGFSDGLIVSFLILLWLFVTIAVKSGFLKVPRETPLPLSGLLPKLNAGNLLRALIFAALTLGWTGASLIFVHSHNLDDTWYGVALVFVPMTVLMVFFVRYLIKAFVIKSPLR